MKKMMFIHVHCVCVCCSCIDDQKKSLQQKSFSIKIGNNNNRDWIHCIFLYFYLFIFWFIGWDAWYKRYTDITNRFRIACMCMCVEIGRIEHHVNIQSYFCSFFLFFCCLFSCTIADKPATFFSPTSHSHTYTVKCTNNF